MTDAARVRTALCMLFAGSVGIACSPSDQQPFGRAPGIYEVRLTGESASRPLLNTAGQIDTVVVLVHVDSIAHDSIFGTYEAEFHRVGLMVGRASPGPQYVAGVIKGDSMHFELTPDATDAGLLLEGSSDGRGVRGTWHTEAHARGGVFTLNKKP
jgi:hypothetical protein